VQYDSASGILPDYSQIEQEIDEAMVKATAVLTARPSMRISPNIPVPLAIRSPIMPLRTLSGPGFVDPLATPASAAQRQFRRAKKAIQFEAPRPEPTPQTPRVPKVRVAGWTGG